MSTDVWNEYDMPSNGLASAITVGPGGSLWIGDNQDHVIDVVSTSTGSIASHPLPSGASAGDMVLGPDGNVWIAGGDSIWKISPTFSSTRYVTPAGVSAQSIVTGSDGNLWFSDNNNDDIGRITPAGSITMFFTYTYGQAQYLTLGDDGNVWFVYVAGIDGATGIGKITPSGSVKTKFVAQVDQSAVGIVTADGKLWVLAQQSNHENLVQLNYHFDVEQTLPMTAFYGPSDLIVGPDGNPWFNSLTPGVGSLSTRTGAFRTYGLAPGNQNGDVMVTGSDDNLWVAGNDIDAYLYRKLVVKPLSISVSVGATAGLTVSETNAGSGTVFSAASQNNSIATIVENGSDTAWTVEGNASGSTIITIGDNKNNSVNIPVTVH
jgi:streptogramin lyase